jgi:hypothetical protein
MADSYSQFLSAAAGMTRETWPDLINKAIDVIWSQKNEAPELVLGQFFDKVTAASKQYVISSGTSHLPMPQEAEDTDPTPYAVAAPGRDKTFTVVNYKLAVRATDTSFRLDRFDKIMYAVSGLVQSTVRFDELHRAQIIDNMFTGTDGDDGKALCASDHPHENNEAGTWDNASTGALSGPNLHAAILLADLMTDPQGKPNATGGPYTLVIPPQLRQTAIELTMTDLKPATALNDVNALLTDVSGVKSPYLSSAVQWAIFGNLQGEDKGIVEVANLDWDISDNKPANVDIRIDRRAKAIKTFGFCHSKNIIGSTGA